MGASGLPYSNSQLLGVKAYSDSCLTVLNNHMLGFRECKFCSLDTDQVLFEM